MGPSELFPMGVKIARTLKGAMDHYASLSAVSPEARRPVVVLWVSSQLEGWNPSVQGVPMLDSFSRAAASEFLGGVAFNLARELNERGEA